MADNPLAQLAKVGQSVWYDQMERSLITTGKLRQLIERDDLRGLTSNPTIFEKAIGGSSDYNDSLRKLSDENKSRDEIYEALVVEDLGNAADLFRPVYDKHSGGDGFVSLEVSPTLANDTAGTTTDAKRFWDLMNRPNMMIKIPATAEGIPAIEASIAAGVNINITLIFSQDVYEQVINAYLTGLERRVAANQAIDGIASVASFFVSRIDALIDKRIDEKLGGMTDEEKKGDLQSLKGKVAIANAKVAYQLFKEHFSSERFEKLRKAGARVQRPLWASTGTKSAEYSDVLYIETLIGPDTVNTIPPKTYDAFRDHGHVALTLEKDVDEARSILDRLAAAGISLDEATDKLTVDGVTSFADSFTSLMQTIDTRRAAEVAR
ncbi:MAG: transaldolase [Acidobacteriota bacterium]